MTDKKTSSLTKFDISTSNYHKRNIHSNYAGMIGRVLVIILLFLLVVAFVRKAYSSTPITFTSFLNWLGGVHSFQLNTSVGDFFIYGDWGLFDGVRNFFNIFTTMFGVLVFLFSNLINLIIFLSQFVLFIFA